MAGAVMKNQKLLGKSFVQTLRVFFPVFSTIGKSTVPINVIYDITIVSMNKDFTKSAHTIYTKQMYISFAKLGQEECESGEFLNKHGYCSQ